MFANRIQHLRLHVVVSEYPRPCQVASLGPDSHLLQTFASLQCSLLPLKWLVTGFVLISDCVGKQFVLVVRFGLEVAALGTIHIRLQGCIVWSDVRNGSS